MECVCVTILSRMASDRKRLVARLDKVFADFIKARDKECVLRGHGQCSDVLQAGHVFSRVAYSTRWDELNCHAQCSSHNLRHEHDPYPYFTWFQAKYGKRKFDSLHKKFAQVKKYTNKELKSLIEYYQKKSDNEH